MNLSRSNLAAQDRLIFALDVGSAAEAKELVTELRPAVSFFKVGLQLFVAAGPEIVRWLTSQGLNVFLDLKIHDVAETVRRAVAEAARLGARFLTIHGGGATAAAARAGRGDSQLRILSVTLLTSHDEKILRTRLRWVRARGSRRSTTTCFGGGSGPTRWCRRTHCFGSKRRPVAAAAGSRSDSGLPWNSGSRGSGRRAEACSYCLHCYK